MASGKLILAEAIFTISDILEVNRVKPIYNIMVKNQFILVL